MKHSGALALALTVFPEITFSQGYTNQTEVPLYGLSPPVYPSRTSLSLRCHSILEMQPNSSQLVPMAQLPQPGQQHMLVRKPL